MRVSRRQAMEMAAGLAGAGALRGQTRKPEIPAGLFQGTRESLKTYQAPQWFRDAKFGIWAHWGPQSAAEYGDWYARNMYIEGHRQYKYHLQTYGHPSQYGFRRIAENWKAEKFNPDELLALYQRAGAKYFVSMGVHHDNFDLWNSKWQPRWNSVATGPKKDIVGLFRKAALKHGLKFGVSEHLAVSYHWFQTSHGSDREGPFKGVPYDGRDERYADLYHATHDAPKNAWDPQGVPEAWKQRYLQRMMDLVDNYQPDLLYTDGPIFFEEWGLAMIAHYYNQSAKRHGGKVEAVYTNKGRPDCAAGACVLDVERGLVDRIWETPWQTDTCIGTWHYNKEAQYKTAKTVVDLLVDIVSRNGNLLLNFPLPASGMLDEQELKVLAGITDWMQVNSSAIYATRPWKIFGEGPATAASADARGAFNERNRKALGAEDFRYVTQGAALYAFCMGWPEKQILAPALGTARGLAGKIRKVEMLGVKQPLKWTQGEAGLLVEPPARPPCEHAVALKITA